jgi:hypothetical protein
MKTYKVKTTKDVDTVQADSVSYLQTVIQFKVKEEEKVGVIFTGDTSDKVVMTYSYHHVISVEELNGN